MKKKLAPLFALLLPIVFGCVPNSDFEGHFEGTLLRRINGKIAQTLVTTDSTMSGSSGEIQVLDLDKKPILTIRISDLSDGSVTFRIPEVMETSGKYKAENECYLDPQGTLGRICHNAEAILIELNDEKDLPTLTLSLDRFSIVAQPNEKPREYHINEALARAVAMNFQARLEYERVLEMKGYMRSAITDLIPAVNTLGTLVTGGGILTALVGGFADFVPFLFPNRWLRIREVSLRQSAQNIALTIMRANTVEELERLVYTLKRDEAIQSDQIELLTMLQKTRSSFTAADQRAKAAIAPANAQTSTPDASDSAQETLSDAIQDTDALIGFLEQDIQTLAHAIAIEKSSLAQILGFRNPEAITDILVDPEDPGAGLTLLPEDTVKTALSRSFELQQLDTLIEATHTAHVETYFSWFDPGSDSKILDSQGLIGFAPPTEAQLKIQREELESVISQRAFQSATEYNQSIRAYALAKKNFDLQHQHLEQTMSRLQSQPTAEVTHLLDRTQFYLRAAVNYEGSIALYQVSRAKVDRLQLSGHYMGLAFLPATRSAENPSPSLLENRAN